MRLTKTSITLLLLGLLATGLYLARAPISMAIAKRMAAQRLASDPLKNLPDGLHVAICGAGSPMPDDQRGGPCTLVMAGQQMFVFDTGNTSARNINKMGFNAGLIDGIFITHFHSDHIDGLGELMLQRWVSKPNSTPVPVYGPAGIDTVVNGFLQAYTLDRGYRVAHHGDKVLPNQGFGAVATPFALQDDKATVVFENADTRITAFSVSHAPIHPAVGYHIRYKDRSLVISGDTTPSAHVQREAQGADLLIHEAMSTELMQLIQEGAHDAKRDKLEQLMKDILNYHSTPQEAAQIASKAQIGRASCRERVSSPV